MTENQVKFIMAILTVLIVVALIYIIWMIIWRALYMPVKMKDDILKERDAAKNELLKIQAAKSVEWDKYKELQEENDKLRKVYFSEKERNDKLRDENAKLTNDKDKILAAHKQLKKEAISKDK